MRKALCTVIVMALLGCATAGKKQSAETLGMIKEGTTTRSQIIELLGPPTVTTMDTSGKEVLVYHYVNVQSGAQNFIPVVGMIQSRMDMNQQIINVLLDKEGLVEKMTVSGGSNTIKSGIITE